MNRVSLVVTVADSVRVIDTGAVDAQAKGDTTKPALDPGQAERVLDAAATLFATRGPKLVTLKWVAMESGIPVEWIASRWPTIRDLLATVLDRGGERASAESPIVPVIHGPGFTEAAEELFDLHDRVIVRTILDGFKFAELMSHFPLLDRLVTDLISSGMEESTARSRALQIAVLELGWRSFSSDLLAACQLDGEAAINATAELRALQQRLARPPAAP